jgi:hypothetical protein
MYAVLLSDSRHFLKNFILLQGPSSADFLEATVAYRLGRNTLFVENFAKDERKLNLLKEPLDTFVAQTVFYLDYGLLVLLYIPIAMTAGFNFWLLWSLRRLKRKLGLHFSQRRLEEFHINKAYKILIKYTGTDGLPKESHKTKDEKMEFIERTLIEQQKCINLPLLLDEIGPSSLLYLLKVLDQKLPQEQEQEQELSSMYSSQHTNPY